MNKTKKGNHEELARTLGLYDVTMIGVAAMIGAGIFVLTGRAAGIAGPAFLLAFFLNGVVAMLTAGAYAELGSSFPEAGGAFMWVAQGYRKIVSFIAGWMGWFSHVVAVAVYSLGFGVYFIELLNFFGLMQHPEDLGNEYQQYVKLGAVLICSVLAWVNFVGVSETGKFGSIMSTVKVVILLLFAVFGFIRIFQTDGFTHYEPFFISSGEHGSAILVLLAMGVTYMAFEGYEVIVQASEEVKNPEKNIPKAIFLSILVVLPIYLLVGGASLGALSISAIPASLGERFSEILTSSGQPSSNYNLMAFLGERAVVESANQFVLPFKFPGSTYTTGMFLVILAGIASTTSALNGTLFSSSRVAFAMGREGLLPSILGRIHKIKRTPYMGLFVTAIIVIVIIVTLPMAAVSAAANVMFLLLFTLVNMTLIKLRKTKPDVKRPFKMPLVPLLPTIAIVMQIVIAIGVFFIPVSPFEQHTGESPGAIAWGVTLIWIFSGLLLYAGPFRKLKPMSRSRVATQDTMYSPQENSILLAVAHPSNQDSLSHLAESVAKVKDSLVHIVSIATIPETTPLTFAPEKDVKKKHDLIERIKDYLEGKKIKINSSVVVGRHPASVICSVSESRGTDLILMGWRGGKKKKGLFLGDTLDRVLADSSKTVAVLKHGKKTPYKNVTVAIGAGPNTKKAINIGARIASSNKGEFSMLAIVKNREGEKEAKERLTSLQEEVKKIDSKLKVNLKIVKSRSIKKAILDSSEESDLLVLGASVNGILDKARLGNIQESIAREFSGSVLTVRVPEARVKRWIHRLLDDE